MRPLFVTHDIGGVLFVGTLAIWAMLEARQGLRRRTGATPADQGSLMVVRLSAIAGALLAALAAARVPEAALPGGGGALGAGLVVMWLGIGLRSWSFSTLGSYFTFTVMTSADQRVITSGPYRFVRHPSYDGILLLLAGIGLAYGNWLSLAALVLLPLLGFLHRIRVEEAALSATLGDAYTSYAQRRKRLVPYVW